MRIVRHEDELLVRRDGERRDVEVGVRRVGHERHATLLRHVVHRQPVELVAIDKLVICKKTLAIVIMFLQWWWSSGSRSC